MKKITKVISGLVLAASMICLASCSMITGLFSDTVYEESGKKLEFAPNSYTADGAEKYNWEYLNKKVKFNIEKGTKYLVTLEATAEEDVKWIGIYGCTKPDKDDSKTMFEWKPFCKNQASASVYGTEKFDYEDILTYKKGSKIIGYAVVSGAEKGKVTGLSISFGNESALPTASKTFNNYKLTITEME